MPSSHDHRISFSPRVRAPPPPRITPRDFNEELDNYRHVRNRNRSTTSPPILMSQNKSEPPVIINLIDDDELEDGEIVDEKKLDNFVNLIEESFTAVQNSKKIEGLPFTPEKLFYEDKSRDNHAPAKIPLYNTPGPNESGGSDVICLDNTQSFTDDSVIFVSEEQKMLSPPKKKPKCASPRKKERLMAWKEKKARKNAEKSNESPQPSTSKGVNDKREKRIILIDGSNVAVSYTQDIACNNSKVFSAEGLEKSISYFEKEGFRVKAVVPEHKLKAKKSTNPTLMYKLKNSGKLIVTPSKSYDDRILLESAMRLDAAIVSNDFFREEDFQKDFKDVLDKRQIRYNFVFGEFILSADPYGREGPHLNDILYK